ncbi:MAG: hypothetical protein KAS29_08995, partial [Bacteroidales bacterium]|nr:hypothetical protein [Bacteroidales bacterium]
MDYSIVPGYGATLHHSEGLEYVTTLEVGEKPYALVVDPTSSYLLVTHDSEEGGVTKVNIREESIDPILTLGELISSVQSALHNQVISQKIASKLLEDLDKTLDRVKSDQFESAIDHLDNFIERVERYMSRGEILEALGNAWLDAAYRIREQLLKDLEAQQSLLKGSGETGSGSGTQDDLQRSDGHIMDLHLESSLRLENRPNPFSNHTQVYFEIPDKGEAYIPVIIRVFNINGQVMKTLVHMDMEPGAYSVIWNSNLDDGGLVPDGIYLLELMTPGQRKAITISVIK